MTVAAQGRYNPNSGVRCIVTGLTDPTGAQLLTANFSAKATLSDEMAVGNPVIGGINGNAAGTTNGAAWYDVPPAGIGNTPRVMRLALGLYDAAGTTQRSEAAFQLEPITPPTIEYIRNSINRFCLINGWDSGNNQAITPAAGYTATAALIDRISKAILLTAQAATGSASITDGITGASGPGFYYDLAASYLGPRQRLILRWQVFLSGQILQKDVYLEDSG